MKYMKYMKYMKQWLGHGEVWSMDMGNEGSEKKRVQCYGSEASMEEVWLQIEKVYESEAMGIYRWGRGRLLFTNFDRIEKVCNVWSLGCGKHRSNANITSSVENM